MADWSMKAHDLLPVIQATLTTGTSAVDLTSATVKFIMTSTSGGTPKINTAATIVTATSGIVSYAWAGTDTNTAGSFNAEWEVTFPSGKKQTFPTIGYHSVYIAPDLDGA